MTNAANEQSNAPPPTYNLTEDVARLTAIEEEREAILERLRAAYGSIGTVLDCYTPPASSPTKPAPKRAARKAPATDTADEAPADAGNAKYTDAELASVVDLVRRGFAKEADPAKLRAAARRGLVRSEGRGRGAKWAVVEAPTPA
jgi:hypothetical protein